MQVIMGGSGSTGSSLLKNILNRHHEIFSGGETAFFAKKMIYEDWQKAKSRVLKRKLFGLRNHGWHIYNGIDLLQEEYLWNNTDLQEILKSSATLNDFTSTFYKKALEERKANIWIEKTPANSACFPFFLKAFENGKAIHMVRNPYDTIASLMSRGFDLYYATGVYLLNTASGISANDPERVHTVKYEDLTSRPETTVRKICEFLGVKYKAEMLEPQGEVVNNSKLEGWQYDETKAIGQGSVGRFKKLSEESQQEILEAVSAIQINGIGKKYYHTQVLNVEEICNELGYDFYNFEKPSKHKSLKKLLVKDRFSRLRRGYPTGYYYPLEIHQ
jgi:phosphoribosylformylglycinamidine (FGAM) synthase PurS component